MTSQGHLLKVATLVTSLLSSEVAEVVSSNLLSTNTH